MTWLNYLLFLYLIFEVSALAQASTSRQNNDNFCSANQCDIDENLAKKAITQCLKNIDECLNKRNSSRK